MLESEVFRLCLPLLLCIFLGFFFLLVSSQIGLDSKLSVVQNDYWVSPNGDFAFGFFNRSDQPNQFSVGIRFNSIMIPVHEQTVVWVAGADVSVGCDSFLHFTAGGDLVLFDSVKGVIAWTSNTSHFSVASAALLDNGNLVLLNQDRVVVWQSFWTPSDTLLPGQNLSISQTLRAASRNAVSSYYSLSMDISGQLKLSWETNVSYWESETSSLHIIGATFTKDGVLQLLDQRFRPVWSRFGEDHNDSSVDFRFLRLDVDGNLRMYSWVESSKSWRLVWQAVKNQCNVFATCGHCGVCVFTPTGTSLCKCLFGSSTDLSPNCLAPFKPKCTSGYTMVAREHTFLYGIYPPNDLITRTSSKQCRNSCLQDPLCTSVTVANDGTGRCFTKKTSFITGYEDPSLASISYVKVCLDPVAALPNNFPASSPSSLQSPLLRRSRGFCAPCLILAVSGTLVAFVTIQIGIGLCFFKRRKAVKKTTTSAFMDPNSRGLITLSYSDIKDLTGNFKHPLGPRVFKGMLPNNQMVAVKDLKGIDREVTMEEKQFKCAISVIGSIHHKNLLKLEGYCCESDHRFLVYEYAKHGSVAKWIEEVKLGKRLTWRKRMEICVGVARAMAYLHMGCREFVSHGNLKWANVVLDELFEAKLTEFGLGRVGGGSTHESGAAERDVVRFGEMVVMIVSGRGGDRELCSWAHEEWADGRAERVLDARVEGGVDADELERTLRIAFWCLQVDERLRPSMGEVLKVLEGTLTVDPPPPPFTHRRPPKELLSESDSEPNL
ncbi:G-type lectin S-receptor-like serine/threonine-protein kinase SD3-1 [Magnolia sinica]|uniref:G-type lectin S-receptor-like serine/threonine-protein kinase SD3-1 n=1 Tax=Magnolia sinica TaxID=86752 RepID=UPI00265B5499|nr:G-type lectin S-receptor-like serine/threonine-protein kinase SD3-1 [Magnolia sinica]